MAQHLLAALAANGATNPVELPIIIPIAKGIWRSVNYTCRDHFMEPGQVQEVVSDLLS